MAIRTSDSRKNRLAHLLGFPLRLLENRRLRLQEELFGSIYDSLLDGIERGVLSVRVKNIPGLFDMNIRSHILRRIIKEREYEPEIVGLIHRYVDADKDAIDIGANVGLFTVLLAQTIKPNKKVLSIEPVPDALEFLRKNIERNSCSKSVIIYDGIASERKGRYNMHVIEGMEEYSSLGSIVHPAARQNSSKSIAVRGETIDNLVRRFRLFPGLMKIDTEGAELQVLIGARATLAKHRPVIVSEVSDQMLGPLGASASAVIGFLENVGYIVKSVERPEQPISYPFEGGILAIHRERLQPFY